MNSPEFKGATKIAKRRLPPAPRGSEASTEDRIASIAAHSEETAAWARSLVETLDPIGQRDAAVRAAARLLRCGFPTATAKRLEGELRRYLTTAWSRGERELTFPPRDASPLRRELWRIAKLTKGAGLAWRSLYEIAERRPG